MDNSVRDYIKLRIIEFVYENGVRWIGEKGFLNRLDKISLENVSLDRDVKIIFTHFGKNQYMNFHILPKDSNSTWCLLIESHLIRRISNLGSLIEDIPDNKD